MQFSRTTKCALAIVACIFASVSANSPSEAPSGSIVSWGLRVFGVDLSADFVAVAAGGRHSLGLKGDGSIVAWGSNLYGLCDVPTPNTDFVAVAAGYWHSLGLREECVVDADCYADEVCVNGICVVPTAWHVDDANCPGPGTGTQPDPFCEIQDGITAAANGDTVLVADGTYTGAGNRDLNFGGRLITLQSESGPGTCIIDCEGAGRGFIFRSGESGDAVVDGFTVRNGSADSNGGGMFISGSSPTILGCVFVGNSVGYRGGGVSCDHGSSPLFLNSYIAENTAEYRGGGINCDHDSSPLFLNSYFVENTAEYRGGGINCDNDSSPIFINSVIAGNTVDYRGGGLYCDHNSNPTLINCVVNDNYAEARGSGVSCDHASHAVVINSTISGNLGGGDGIFVDHESIPTIRNSIVWGNTSSQLGGQTEDAVVTFSNFQGGWPGVGNIDGDPLFVDVAGGNYRVSSGSPCIDAADNTAVPPDTLDVDGDGDTDEPIPLDLDLHPRFVNDLAVTDTGNPSPGIPNRIVDMGAYEFHPPIVIAAHLDIKPGSCPNPVNPRSKGVVPVAIIGSESFDVTQIDIDSLLLARADGVGGVAALLGKRHGAWSDVADVGTPFDGEPCDCHELGADGIDDLLLKFSTPELAEVLELGSLPRGASVILTLSGSLLDGTGFEASDCIVIPGKDSSATLRGARR